IPWRGRKQEEKSSALPLVLGIGAAVFVLLLLVGGVVGYVIYRASSAKDTMQQVADTLEQSKPPEEQPNPKPVDRGDRPGEKTDDPKRDPDPKPKPVGSVTRELIVGRWSSGGKVWEFKAGNQLQVKTPQRTFNGTYTFIGDDIAVILDDVYAGGETFSGRWNLVVTSTTLRMWRAELAPDTAVEYRRLAPG